MKKINLTDLPEYAPLKAALEAPSGAPARLTDDRRRRILNAARRAAAFEPTFADRLSRWLDFQLPYAALRALAPVAILLVVFLGLFGLLLPALSPARHKAKSLRDRSVEVVTMPMETEYLHELQKLEDLPTVVDAVAPPAADTEPPASEAPNAPIVFKGLWSSGRSGASREEALKKRDVAGVNGEAKDLKDERDLSREKAKESGGRSDESDLSYRSDSDGDRFSRGREAAAAAPASGSISSTLSMPSTPSAPTPAKKPEPAQPSTFRAAGFNPFVEAARQPFSTFAIDVDTAAYTLARNYLNRGQLPPPEAVRTEEIVNFFDYHYTPPAEALFAVHAECAPSPFGPGFQLLRVGVKARRLGREENRRAVLTFAVDTSGSMSSPERLGLIKQALRLLADRLSPNDLVALVQFDSTARLVLDYTPASDKARILAAVDALQTSGSTDLEQGMRLAYECARRAFQPGAGNRVLLLSDGAANLGGTSAEEILAVAAESRRQGILCSVYGVGRAGFNDVMLETLANKGDGSYVFLDSIEEARRVFVDELAATLNTVAADVKIQVEFNPGRVALYRQLGYENRKLRTEDFRNDAIDAGEVGSGQSVTALYELTFPPEASKTPLAIIRIRFRNLLTGRVEEIASPVTDTLLLPRFADADPSFKLAAGAAEFAELLRGSPFASDGRHAEVASLLRPVALEYSLDNRVQELLRLVEKAAALAPSQP